MDKLLSGVLGEDDKNNGKSGSGDMTGSDDSGGMKGLSNVDGASHGRAAVREGMIDSVLTEYASNPVAQVVKVKKKKVGRYPCYNCRKAFGCAHTDLHTAVLEGKLSTLRKTLRRLAKTKPELINELDEKGRSPLSLAVKEGRENIADLILSASDSDPDVRDKWTGMTAMHHASHLGLTNTVSKLLWRQANINAPDNNGTTPLMMACSIGNERMVDLLLEENADPERKDNYGWNCLFYASYGGSAAVTRRILNEGVNKRLKDRKKMRAIDWAEFMKHGEVTAMLENFKIEMSTDKYKSTFG